jgi:hypothetical protein
LKKFFVVFCFAFLVFGGVAFGQSTDVKNYVGDTLAQETTPEEAIDLEGDFIFDFNATNQYTPNIRKQRDQYIRELIEEGLLPQPVNQGLGVSTPTSINLGHGASLPDAGVKAPVAPVAPVKPPVIKTP